MGPPSHEPDRTGFTLIEVLAAVLVLGVLYTVLAGVAIQGLRAEGESRRRLEASLLADRLVTEMEESLQAGSVPPLGRSEQEEGAFTVHVDVTELPPSALLPPEETKALVPEVSLLAGQTTSQEGRVRQIQVHVAWFEGEAERRVVRTTYAFDVSGLEEQIAAANAARSGLDPGLEAEGEERPSEESGGVGNLGGLSESQLRESLN